MQDLTPTSDLNMRDLIFLTSLIYCYWLTSPHAVEFPIPYGTTAAPYARVSGQTATRDGYGYWFADKGTTCALKTNDLKALTNLSTSF